MPFEQQMSDPDLWRRICDYEFPRDQFGHSFEQYLVNNSQWSPQDIATVVEEYRRFAYVSAMQDQLLVAPPSIDRVWAHHRAFVEDYESQFLPLIGLQYWEPFEGSRREYKQRLQNADLYYEREFGARPPELVWRKARLWRPVLALVILLSVVIGPVLLGSGDVLVFVVIMAGVFAAGWVVMPNFRTELPKPEGRPRKRWLLLDFLGYGP